MPRPITAVVYESDGVTLAGTSLLTSTLTSDAARKWLDDFNDVGRGDLEIKSGTDDEVLLSDGRIVRFFINGTARFPWQVEGFTKILADPDQREAGKKIPCGGRGLLSLLENAVVFPELGLNAISPTTRYFNFSSKYFDASTWAAAVGLAQQGAFLFNPKYGFPSDWPDVLSWWLWDATGFSPPTAVGDVYFHAGPFTITNTTDVRIFITADDGWELYFDGNKLSAELGPGLWGKTRYVDVRVTGGMDHVWAIKGTNITRPNPLTNGAGVLLYACELLDGGDTLGPAILRSDPATWKMLPYPATPPGMTPGHILTVLINEAHARGTLLNVGMSFSPTTDSAGNPWPAKIDVSFPVGTNYLEVVRHLVDEHACDVAFDASSMTLHAWVSRGQTRLYGAVLGGNPGANVGRLTIEKSAAGPNTALGQNAAGVWVVRERSGSVATWGRKEISLSLGSAPSDEAAERQIDAFLDDHAEPVESVSDLQMEVVGGGPTPYVDFDNGDRIKAPTYSTVITNDNRVHGIAVSEDDAGQPIYSIELVRT